MLKYLMKRPMKMISWTKIHILKTYEIVGISVLATNFKEVMSLSGHIPPHYATYLAKTLPFLLVSVILMSSWLCPDYRTRCPVR